MAEIVSKEYLEREYRLAILDFKTAKSEEEQWSARKIMARLEEIAAKAFGFDYVDELKNQGK